MEGEFCLNSRRWLFKICWSIPTTCPYHGDQGRTTCKEACDYMEMRVMPPEVEKEFHMMTGGKYKGKKKWVVFELVPSEVLMGGVATEKQCLVKFCEGETEQKAVQEAAEAQTIQVHGAEQEA